LPRPPTRTDAAAPPRLDAALLRDSFHSIVERSPSLAHRFYEILFTRFPEAKSLFGRNSAPKQERMLADALTGIIDHLEDAPWLSQTLLKLGARHASYGVTDEMYEWVGVSLLNALSEVAGTDWTPRVTSAWTDAYAAISGLMLAGAREYLNHQTTENVSSPT
jgi:hemoglobin-like flavoprotein